MNFEAGALETDLGVFSLSLEFDSESSTPPDKSRIGSNLNMIDREVDAPRRTELFAYNQILGLEMICLQVSLEKWHYSAFLTLQCRLRITQAANVSRHPL